MDGMVRLGLGLTQSDSLIDSNPVVIAAVVSWLLGTIWGGGKSLQALTVECHCELLSGCDTAALGSPGLHVLEDSVSLRLYSTKV